MSRDSGVCRACPAAIVWVEMVDAAGLPKVKNGKAVRNPLDAEPLSEEQAAQALTAPTSRAAAGVIARSAAGHGMALGAQTAGRISEWVTAGSVKLHRSHFASCPARSTFAS